MKIQQALAISCLTTTTTIFWTHSALALPSYYELPTELAVEAATEAVQTCQKEGYNVTATVVNREGGIQVVIRGDGATPHTLENSFNKAYTVITLGPIQKVDSTADIIKKSTPSALPLGTWPMPPSPLKGIVFSIGGLAIKVGDNWIGGLGVAGSPGGQYDQACAQAGLDKIKSRLIP